VGGGVRTTVDGAKIACTRIPCAVCLRMGSGGGREEHELQRMPLNPPHSAPLRSTPCHATPVPVVLVLVLVLANAHAVSLELRAVQADIRHPSGRAKGGGGGGTHRIASHRILALWPLLDGGVCIDYPSQLATEHGVYR